MSALYIGLISGTSMDGIDAALVDTDTMQMLASYCQPYPKTIRELLIDVIQRDDITDPRITTLDKQLGELFATTALTLLEQSGFSINDIKAIGSHGQNISHHPELKPPYTLQIADPKLIADVTGTITVSNFRTADVVAGGQGAPLAPLLHEKLFATRQTQRAIVNIGGIANVTILSNQATIGFDTGPGNGLLDAWIEKHLHRAYDKNGEWAKSGNLDQTLLTQLLADPYFKQLPPKSTGKEYFNLAWLKPLLTDQSAVDVQRTLLEFTAQSIVNAVKSYDAGIEIILCGGGAHNEFLVERLQNLHAGSVTNTDFYHIDGDYLEAMLFAWLAEQRLAEQLLDTTHITGAQQPILLGDVHHPKV